jgi:hypothetical protein
MTSTDGERRGPAMTELFAHLESQQEIRRGTEFAFHGNRDVLWDAVTAFVDEESLCCPFYTFEQRETEDGVTLSVTAEAAPLKLEA